MRPDLPRLLHVRSEFAYTDQPHDALPDEPEAVSADYQRRLSTDAPRRAQAREREVLLLFRQTLVIELAALRGYKLNTDIVSCLRVIERQVERIDRLI